MSDFAVILVHTTSDAIHAERVLKRAGHTEAAVDLCRLAGTVPAGVLCELVEDDGSMMRGRRLVEFAVAHQIPMLSIAELVTHRWTTETLVRREAEALLQQAAAASDGHLPEKRANCIRLPAISIS